MTSKLNSAQESYALTLQQMLGEDLFACMLSPIIIRQLSRGIAFAMPIERMLTNSAFSSDRAPMEINDYIKPYLGRVWPYFPISNLLTEQFKDQVRSVATAAVIQELEYAEARGESSGETLAERLNG